MRFIELEGTPRQIGEQHGTAFRDDIRKYHDFYCRQRGKTVDRLDPSISTYLEKRFPYLVEEMQGIAHGAGMTYSDVLVYNLFPFITGCTPVFMRDTEVGPIIGQNLDCERMEQDAGLIRVVRPHRGNSFIGVTFVGTVWAGNALNDKGLGVAGVSAHQKHYLVRDATTVAIAFRDVMQRAETLDGAYEILRSHRYLGKIGVHIVCDGNGDAFRLEMDNEKYLRVPLGGFGFSTGLYETGEIEARNEPDYIRMKEERKATIDGLYQAGKIAFSTDGLKSLLSYHHTPGSVCRHEPWQTEGSNTQSARVMIPRQRKLLITDGPPCSTEWAEYSF